MSERVACFLVETYRMVQDRPGAIWFAEHDDTWCYSGWTNCDGKHLMVCLPNKRHWDVDSRASNCTLKDEGKHRCWVRHGTPPVIHVDKNGITCRAGAGSIQSYGAPSAGIPAWHGFLTNGFLQVQR